MTIGTGKGIVHADGVDDGDLLVASGTRYRPQTPSLTGKTDNWAVYGSTGYSTQVATSGGSAIYLKDDSFNTIGGAGYTAAYVPTRPHTHNLSGGVADARISFT